MKKNSQVLSTASTACLPLRERLLNLIVTFFLVALTGLCTLVQSCATYNSAGQADSDSGSICARVAALVDAVVGPDSVEERIGVRAWTNTRTDKKLKILLYGIYYDQTNRNAYPDFDAALAVVLWERDDIENSGKGLRMCGLIWVGDGKVRYCEVTAFHP